MTFAMLDPRLVAMLLTPILFAGAVFGALIQSAAHAKALAAPTVAVGRASRAAEVSA